MVIEVLLANGCGLAPVVRAGASRGPGGQGPRRDARRGIRRPPPGPRQDVCRAARGRRHEARDVAAAPSQAQPCGALAGAGRGSIDTVATDHCPFDTSQKRLGQAFVRRHPERDRRDRRSGQPALHLRRRRWLTGHPPLRGRREHARGEAVRPLPAQGHDRGRQRRGPRGLRSGLSGHHFGRHAARQQRLQRVRGHGHRRAPVGRDRARSRAGAGRAVRRRPTTWPAAASSAGPWGLRPCERDRRGHAPEGDWQSARPWCCHPSSPWRHKVPTTWRRASRRSCRG